MFTLTLCSCCYFFAVAAAGVLVAAVVLLLVAVHDCRALPISLALLPVLHSSSAKISMFHEHFGDGSNIKKPPISLFLLKGARLIAPPKGFVFNLPKRLPQSKSRGCQTSTACGFHRTSSWCV